MDNHTLFSVFLLIAHLFIFISIMEKESNLRRHIMSISLQEMFQDGGPSNISSRLQCSKTRVVEKVLLSPVLYLLCFIMFHHSGR